MSGISQRFRKDFGEIGESYRINFGEIGELGVLNLRGNEKCFIFALK